MVINPISENTDVFSRNLEHDIIYLVGEINDEMAASVMAQLFERDCADLSNIPYNSQGSCWSINPSDKMHEERPISLYINSPGGSVSAGLAIYDAMRSLDRSVITICAGMAASMAAVILAGGDRRYILPHAEVMIHQPSGGALGKASDILVAADHIRDRKKVLYEILSERTGHSYDTILNDAEHDFWMNAKEAVDYGIVDEILILK